MKKLLLSTLALVAFGSFAQTTIFEDNFEAGGGNWTLNGGFGDNAWSVDNNYTGYSPFVADTPSQPGAITNSPFSTYLHIRNGAACGSLGICNASFDTGSTSDQSATMTNNLNTTGQTDVTISFYYLCAGQAGLSYGNLEYSINNGVDWVTAGTDYVNVGAWTQSTVTLPQWSNQATLKFRFRWRNGAGGNDPAFAVDQILMTANTGAAAPEITASVAGGLEVFCGGDDIEVDYEVTDVTLNAGNVFTLELSDAAGSFAAPTAIGTLNGTATTGSVIGSIPAGATPGLGYRVRVNSSNDAQTGTDNGVDLIIASTPATPTITLNGGGDLESSYGGTNIWYQDGFVIAGESGQTITPLADGTYTVQATNDTCVSALSDPFVYADASIEGVQINPFTLYPNPTNELLNIKGNVTNISSFEVVDISGKTLIQHTNSVNSIDVSGLARGSYFLRIHTADMLHTLKFIKE